MKICIIGKSNHARFHHKFIKEMNELDNILFYHPTFTDNIDVFNDMKVFLDSDLVIIASPTESHLHYLKLLEANHYTGYIYIEKPGFNDPSHQIDLMRLGEVFKGRIKIGYHMRDSKVVKALGDFVNESGNKGLIIVRAMITKNISGTESFLNSWRAYDKFAISHTLASHLLSVFVELFGVKILENIDLGLMAANRDADTCILSGFTDEVYISGVASWGLTRVSPYIEVITKDSRLIFSNNKLKLLRVSENSILASTTILEESLSIKRSIQEFARQARKSQQVDHKVFVENVRITTKAVSNILELSSS